MTETFDTDVLVIGGGMAGAWAASSAARAGAGLGIADWMLEILAVTWDTVPTLAPYYRFGVEDSGEVNYRAMRGPEYMRALRAQALEHGVCVLDHHPALELLGRSDGGVGGARDVVRRQMQGFNRALFRNADGLAASTHALADGWREMTDHAGGADLPTRETAGLLAAARWSTSAAAARAETRGMDLRVDAPATDPTLAHRLILRGLDAIHVALDA